MRKCNGCLEDKPIDEFSWKNEAKGIRQYKCKSCHKVYVNEHYNNNKTSYKGRAERDRKKEYLRDKELLVELKIGGCILCQEERTHLLDLHHLDPSTKEGSMRQMASRKKMKEEAKKCVVLCSNCHRHEHHLLRQGESQLKDLGV